MLKCALYTQDNRFIDVINKAFEIISDWNDIINYKNYIASINTEIFKLLDHIHKNHLHGKKHSVNEQKEAGYKSGCINISIIDRLVREIQTQTDRDCNGLVYGDDFIFSDLDPDYPRNIRETQIQLEAEFGRLEDKFMSVKDYYAHFGLSPSYSAEIYDPIQKAIVELLKGKKEKNKNVYGQDYIIDPNDKQKPKVLIDLEKQLNISDKIKKISYQDYLKLVPKIEEEEININNNNLSSKTESEKKIDSICSYVSTRLVSEWLYQFDIDNNGLIYGNDFILKDDNYFKSQCLKELEEDEDWNPPEDIVKMTWDQFCLTFPDKNPDDRYKTK